MKILWMTSLRPIGASKENDKIQNLFLNSVLSIDKYIKFSLTQFDDKGVFDYIKKKKSDLFMLIIKRNFYQSAKNILIKLC